MVAARELIGTWKIVDYVVIGADGTLTRLHEPGSIGTLIYTADGHMSASMTARILYKGEADRTVFLGYCGPYECRDTYVLHHVQVASDPALVGTAQRRNVRFDGDKLILSAAPSIAGGPGSRSELHWRRV
ncbi:MAG: lipocalin-like domain-containing protein [Alphaproteobacteria bacterium]|nr:lipocalin-like domain-containing protein [Alphaproteobacteria bacterium]